MGIKSFSKITLLYFVVYIVFTSCSWQNRLYNKGFYISKIHALAKVEQKSNATNLVPAHSSTKHVKAKEVSTSIPADASYKTIIEIAPAKIKPTRLANDFDKFLLKDKTQTLSKVSQTNSGKIKDAHLRSFNKPIVTKKNLDFEDIMERYPGLIALAAIILAFAFGYMGVMFIGAGYLPFGYFFVILAVVLLIGGIVITSISMANHGYSFRPWP